ncbi:MAG: UspA domain protein [Ilumatobacteraceae bacterium]|nr:UspA domain protein [Ilumatobacteraceae bacterium]
MNDETAVPTQVAMHRIVVGVDSTKPSAAALEWALAEAKLRGATLDIVVSWDFPVLATTEPVMIPQPDRDTLVHSATLTATHMLAEAHLDDSGVAYTVHTPEGRPGEELVAIAAGADLLVVGSHGSGVLKELILGSVSNYCAHHSTCPVVLVRSPD